MYFLSQNVLWLQNRCRGRWAFQVKILSLSCGRGGCCWHFLASKCFASFPVQIPVQSSMLSTNYTVASSCFHDSWWLRWRVWLQVLPQSAGITSFLWVFWILYGFAIRKTVALRLIPIFIFSKFFSPMSLSSTRSVRCMFLLFFLKIVFKYTNPCTSVEFSELSHDLPVCPCFIYVQGLSVPFACVGSGDPVRVLHLYTTNTLDVFEAFIAEAYVQLAATDSTVLCSSLTLWDFLLLLLLEVLVSECHVWVTVHVWVCHTVLCGALYTACVDASRTVFWDCSVLR